MVVRFGPGVAPGWLVTAAGVGLSIVGWYQISGQPTDAQQMPYLASATIPGAALIVAGSVLLAGRRAGERRPLTRPLMPQTADSARWALPSGTYAHRADCPLLDGKSDAFEITGELLTAGRAPTRPCPICDPGPVGAP